MMSEQWANRMVGGGSRRVFRLVVNQPSWIARVVVILAVLLIFTLLAAVIIPALLIGATLLVAGAIAGKTRAWLRGLRAPNGALDERRNVRVIVRE